MKRPTFFLSSTILDFQDLRSALKFYLEEQGCEVLASEFNDFTKPLDKHSYDACLEAIHSADYFILLIGSRVGGWYDETSRVSITMREYREAYELQTQGKIKLLNFVRDDVWRVREDRRELSQYLESLSVDKNLRKIIVNYPSKFAADAAFISEFITEVGRNHETKTAVRGEGLPPTGNWIHVFHGFRDIVDVLNAQTFSSTPIEDLTIRRLLRRELCEYLKATLWKWKSDLYGPREVIDWFHEDHLLDMAARDQEEFYVSTKRWDQLASFSFQLLGLKLHPVVLPQALSVPTFLEFDLASSTYKETPVYEALFLLSREIRKLSEADLPDVLSIVFQHTPKVRRPGVKGIYVNTLKLASFLSLMDRWANVVALSAALLRYLDDGTFQTPDLRPESPIQGLQDLIDQERPTVADVESFLKQVDPH